MWDRQTESWWQQLTGEAVVGQLSGTRLRALPVQVLSWGQFKRRFPAGDVISQDTGLNRDYGANPYQSYDAPDSDPFLFDGRLPPKERVLALHDRGEPVAIPFTALRRRPVRVRTDYRTVEGAGRRAARDAADRVGCDVIVW
jgi:hypothetical protein